MTRGQAIEQGLKTYSSEKVCPRGHVGERRVRDSMCCACVGIVWREMYHRNKPSNAKKLLASKKKEFEKIKKMQKDRGIDLPFSRAEAKASGSTFYFNGKPCPKGHITIRRTKSPGCEECMPGIHKANLKKRKAENPESVKAAKRRHYERHAEEIKAKAKAWGEANVERRKEKSKAYQKANPHIYRISGSIRRARKKNATPPWVTGEVLQRVKDIYIEASKLTCSQGLRLAVDHIVPLKHEDVCGLHVPANLRLATKLENSKKNNRFDEHLGRECAIPLGCGVALGSYQLL